jgi:hypothetical protein
MPEASMDKSASAWNSTKRVARLLPPKAPRNDTLPLQRSDSNPISPQMVFRVVLVIHHIGLMGIFCPKNILKRILTLLKLDGLKLTVRLKKSRVLGGLSKLSKNYGRTCK